MSLAALFLWVGLLNEKGEQEENDGNPDPQEKAAKSETYKKLFNADLGAGLTGWPGGVALEELSMA